MANTSGIRAGRAFVELFTNDKALRRGLDSAAQKLKAWGAVVNGIGLRAIGVGMAAITPLIAASKVFSSMGETLHDASARTGIAVENLSALAYAAEQSGSNLGDLETGIRHMSKALTAAAGGSEEAIDAFNQLGLSGEKLAGMSQVERFNAIADALSRIEDPALKAGLAVKLLGKSGTKLLPMMEGGAAGLKEMTDQAERLGLVWSTEAAAAADEFGDRTHDLWAVLKKLAADVGGAVVPIVREFVMMVTRGAVDAMKWVKEHQKMIQTALKIAAAVVAAGAAFVVIGTALSAVGAVVGGVSAAMGLLAKATAGVGVVLKTMLFTGIGLTTTALAGLGAALLYNSGIGSKVLTFLGNMFAELKGIAGTAIQGITDALKAGDWVLAAEIAWLGLKTAFQAGIQPLKDLWTNFARFFQNVAAGAFYGALALWEEVQTKIAAGFLYLKDVAGKAFFLMQMGAGGKPNQAFQFMKIGAGMATGTEFSANLGTDISFKSTLAEELAALEAAKKARLAAIGEAANAQFKANDDNAKDQIEADRERIEELKRQLGAMGKGPGAQAKLIPPRIPSVDNLASALDEVAKNTVGISGTFSAAAVRGMGGGGALKEIADATKDTAKNTKDIAKRGYVPPSIFS